jgi:hypothetical protein
LTDGTKVGTIEEKDNFSWKDQPSKQRSRIVNVTNPADDWSRQAGFLLGMAVSAQG